jgi:hypothetical protein
MVHAINLGGIQKPLHVLFQAEDRRPTLRVVASDTFEDARTVVENMRHHMHARVVPLNELAIMPNDIANAWSAHVFSLAIFWKHFFLTP